MGGSTCKWTSCTCVHAYIYNTLPPSLPPPSQFPKSLDIEPYTAEGITSREKGLGPSSPLIYDLTGIIVHQGQASAGHYYAFIKTKG